MNPSVQENGRDHNDSEENNSTDATKSKNSCDDKKDD